jgi:hypothetical protein
MALRIALRRWLVSVRVTPIRICPGHVAFNEQMRAESLPLTTPFSVEYPNSLRFYVLVRNCLRIALVCVSSSQHLTFRHFSMASIVVSEAEG